MKINRRHFLVACERVPGARPKDIPYISGQSNERSQTVCGHVPIKWRLRSMRVWQCSLGRVPLLGGEIELRVLRFRFCVEERRTDEAGRHGGGAFRRCGNAASSWRLLFSLPFCFRPVGRWSALARRFPVDVQLGVGFLGESIGATRRPIGPRRPATAKSNPSGRPSLCRAQESPRIESKLDRICTPLVGYAVRGLSVWQRAKSTSTFSNVATV